MSGEVVLYDDRGKALVRTEKRSLAFSEVLREKMPVAKWTKWTVKKAVNEGLKSSVWIYRSFGLISGSAASVPFRVVNKESNEPIENHPLNQVLSRPNNQLSRKDCFSLIYNWLLLTGIAYFFKGPPMAAIPGTFPLWPVSPDRIAPVRSKDIELMIEGYSAAEDKDKPRAIIKYKPEEIIAFRHMNPANPLEGISPLQAAARVIDTDSEQQNFNKSAMQNRGVLDGMITFEMPLTQDQLDAQAEAWKERNQGSEQARNTAFFGNHAKYHRLSLTPAEADFGESRKNNRDEILAAVGTPSQLVNAQEASTYDNFRVSEIIHWRNAIVPLIDIVVDGMNFFFRNTEDLKEEEHISPDYSEIQALQQNFEDKTKAAEKLFKIGVPVKTVSTMLKLGIEEFEGWDLPYNGRDVKINPATGERTQVEKETTEGEVEETKSAVWEGVVELQPWALQSRRMGRAADDLEGEAKEREKIAEKRAKPIAKILKAEQDLIEGILKDAGEKNAMDAVVRTFKEEDPFGTAEEWIEELNKTAMEAGIQAGKNIVIESRAFEDDLATGIEEALNNEATILMEKSNIDEATARTIVHQVADGLDNGLSIAEITAAINDTGMFSPERALRITRTIAGTGSSLGQLTAADMSGAKKKTWVTSGFGVRDLHTERDGETVGINEEFTKKASPNGAFPRYPLDPNIAAEDRINCRCSMTFS